MKGVILLVALIVGLTGAADVTTSVRFTPGMKTFSLLVQNGSTGDVLTALTSGDVYAHSRGKAAALVLVATSNSSGIDELGYFIATAAEWGDSGSPNPKAVLFVTEVKEYPSLGNVLVFTQRYPNGAVGTSTGDKNGVASAFPSFVMQNPELGFVHFSGFMAGHYPQYGIFSSTASGGNATTLVGGMRNSGAICLFLESLQMSLVVSPFSSFMSSSVYVHSPATGGPRVAQWGIMGGATSIPAGFESSWIIAAYSGGINTAMKKWGSVLLDKYGKSVNNGHQRDLTLQYLGYSTDNGAFYYYYQGNHSTYQETMIEVKKYADQVHLPYAYLQLDSWWYYQGVFEGVKNWTAQPWVFPGGLQAVHNATRLPIQAHNRYWALDNVYASNPQFPVGPTEYDGPKFEFVWGNTGGLPRTYEFWDALFTANSDWGLHVYEQDWLSTVTDDLPTLQQNVTFGRDWLLHMGRAAEKHGLSIQYCMSYPRHVFTSLLLQSVTQARASDDYYPESHGQDLTQWNTAESGLWISSIGISPSKDNYWSMPNHQYNPHYNLLADTYETRNRLESLSSSLGNGPVQPSDRIGYSDTALIMRCCAMNGLLLRPAVTASPLDRSFAAKAFGGPGGPKGNVHVTYSAPPHARDATFVFLYTYLFSGNLASAYSVTYQDLELYHASHKTLLMPSSWVAYEANSTTAKFQILSPSSPLQLNPSDDWTFEYFTLVPVYSTISTGWYLQGETSKWIAASAQRISSIMLTSDGAAQATAQGTAGEAVTLSFVHATSLLSKAVTCVVNEQLRVTAKISSLGVTSCSYE